MKQTNNAIKFLMAQYRAIFKNANIAMVAAMAAAALAAGQAQAATDFTAIQDGTVFKTGSLLEVSADGKKENTKSFTATIQSGKNTIDSTGTANQELVAKSGTFVIDGNGAKLTIGGSSGAKVTLASMQIKEGELVLVNDGTKNSDLKATGSIIIGEAANAAAPKAGKVAKVTIGKSGTLTTEGDESVFTVNANGEIAFTKDATADTSKITAAKGVNLVGGTISVANSGAATVEGDINASGGKIVVGGDGTDATELTVNGNVAFKGEGGAVTIAADGKLTVTHKTEHVSLDLGKATVTNGGTIDFGTLAADKKATLKLSSAQYNEVFKGKVTAAGAASSKLYVDVQGNEQIDLDTILNDGALDANKVGLTTAVLGGINATSAKYDKHADFKVSGVFGDLVLGKSNAATISNAAVVEITKGLEVNGGSASGTLSVTAGTLKLNGAGAEHDVQAKSITLGATGNANTVKLDVLGGGTWSVNDVTLTKGLATVDGGSTLVINGDLTTTGATSANDGGVLTITNASTLDATAATKLTLTSGTSTKPTIDVQGGSTLELKADQVFTVNGNTVTLTNGSGADKSKVEQTAIKLSSDSVLQFKTGSDFTLSKAGFDDLITKLGDNTAIGGFVSFGDGFKLSDVTGGEIALDEVKKGDVYNGATATTANGTVNQDVMLGSIKVTTNDGKVSVGGGKTVILYKAADGNFVSNKIGPTDVSVGDAANLTLAGDGAVGAIDGAAANNGNVTFGHSRTGETAGTVTVESIGATNGVASVTVARGDVVVNGKAENGQPALKLQTQKLSLAKGTSLKAVGHDVTVTGTGTTKLDGNLTAGKLVFSAANASASIANGALVDVGEFSVSGTGTVSIGTPGVDENNKGTSGTLDADKLTLGGATLFVDPALGDKAAIAAVEKLSDKDANGDAQVLDGKIIVGMNSAVGVGFAGDDKRGQVEQYLIDAELMDPTSKSFKADVGNVKSIKSALILKTPIKVAANKGVLVSSEAKASSKVTDNSFTLAKDGSLIINDSVYGLDGNGAKSGSAVAFDTKGTVTVDSSSKIILTGDFDGADDGIKIFDNVNAITDRIVVTSANGILSGELDANGKIVDLRADDTKLKGAFATISEPVRELLKERIVNSRNTFDKSQLGAQFLGKVANDILDTTGIAADAAAHAATYAGAQQAAVASVTTMADAMFGRVGAVGVEAASIAATGSQANGGVWLTPMYKSMDSDGFNAQGASYGSDVDAAGVAFGADTVNGNMRFGAVFNIGSGDAEGKGNGNGLKDEFDYYGFGIYSAMGFGNFALVGDASMTVVSHDVEGFGLRGKADTTAVTMGITGQYTVTTPVVDVTPHLGARFIRLNTDSYDLISADGLLATTDFDVQNVFSVPLGVTLSKAFVAGGWSLAPSADLTVTFNSGDTEAKSTTTFTGAHAIGLNTEVLDEVQYGLTVGLGAQYGAFGTSFGINYTGSENTDSFGVNAQCRYMF